MQIEINGKRNITLDFNAPKKFRLVKDGAEIPYIRTGKNSFRLSKPVDGFVELEEIVEQPRYMQPVQLQPQQMTVINPQDVDRLNEAVRQMALVNPQDVMIINQTAEQLEKNQNFIAQTQKEITNNQAYIDQQQQRLNETALGIQALETDNSQRLDGAENAILNLAGEISNAQNMAVDGMNTALNKIEEQGILLQAEIDKKADKDELESLKKDFEEKSDRISSAMSNYSGGTAYDTLPQGGEAGQILAKRTDRQGDYIWIDQTPVIVKSKTIPTASEKYKGEVYQYVGETGDYTHGYIYECQEIENNFVWVRLDVQPNTAVWGQITGTLSDQTDLQNALNGKQDKLTQTQLDAVNSGANSTNIAQITTNQNNINSINDKIPAQATSTNQLADKDYVDTADNDLQTAINGKQDILVSGTNIKTINNNSILGSGNLDINGLPTQTGQSGKFLTTNGSSASWENVSVTGDNKSITKNASQELQTVGVINSRDSSTAIKTWTGTKAQYDALKATPSWYAWTYTITIYTISSTPNIGDNIYIYKNGVMVKQAVTITNIGSSWIEIDDTGQNLFYRSSSSDVIGQENRINPNTLYNITDDTDVSLTILEALYPVGSIYITTANTCPLSALISGSTWELVSSGRVLQGADSGHSAGTTIEAGLPNIIGKLGLNADRNNFDASQSGAFYREATGGRAWASSGGTAQGLGDILMDASLSNSIYGNSSTVQPPAYVVNIYRRTA